MASLWIREYVDVPQQQSGIIPVPTEPGTDQTVLAISASHAESAVFQASTRYVRMTSDSNFAYTVGTAPVAAGNALRCVAGAMIDFAIPDHPPGNSASTYKVSAITVS